MKRLAAFLKATTLGGLFVVLPVLVVFGLLTKLVLGVQGAAQALMEKLMGKESEAAHFPLLFAVLFVIGISFLFGLVMLSRHGQTAGQWIERKILIRVPGYSAVRAIVGGLAGATHEGAVKTGILRVEDGIESFVFVIEDHGTDLLTVYIPGSPNPGSGNVQIVRRDLVRMLNVRITDIGAAMQQWGMGSAKVLAKHTARSLGDPHPSGTSQEK